LDRHLGELARRDLLRLGVDQFEPEGRPGGDAVRVEHPDREVGQHAAVDEGDILAPNFHRERLEEDRDAHTHPDRIGDLEAVRILPEDLRVPRQEEQLMVVTSETTTCNRYIHRGSVSPATLRSPKWATPFSARRSPIHRWKAAPS